VMATASGRLEYERFSAAMMCFNRTDLPVPADPVKKIDSPFRTRSNTLCCSGDNDTCRPPDQSLCIL
jgi:hypothetical protein